VSEAVDAQWSISLCTECPECKEEFDILELDDYFEYLTGMEVLDADKEIEVPCPRCEQYFTVRTMY
jgi:phage FluMu protein Com